MSPQTDRRLEVFLDTNNKCNLKCLTCAFSDPRVSQLKTNMMSLELFDRICDEVLTLAEYATLSCLTEPLMTREFSQFLARAGRCEIPSSSRTLSFCEKNISPHVFKRVFGASQFRLTGPTLKPTKAFGVADDSIG